MDKNVIKRNNILYSQADFISVESIGSNPVFAEDPCDLLCEVQPKYCLSDCDTFAFTSKNQTFGPLYPPPQKKKKQRLQFKQTKGQSVTLQTLSTTSNNKKLYSACLFLVFGQRKNSDITKDHSTNFSKLHHLPKGQGSNTTEAQHDMKIDICKKGPPGVVVSCPQVKETRIRTQLQLQRPISAPQLPESELVSSVWANTLSRNRHVNCRQMHSRRTISQKNQTHLTKESHNSCTSQTLEANNNSQEIHTSCPQR